MSNTDTAILISDCIGNTLLPEFSVNNAKDVGKPKVETPVELFTAARAPRREPHYRDRQQKDCL